MNEPGKASQYRELECHSQFLRFFSKIPERFLDMVFEGERASTLHFRAPLGKSLLITGVHLKSKLHAESDDQRLEVTSLSQKIREKEAAIGHENSIVIGDMNMHPFESAMISCDGFHAVMSKKVALRRARIVGKQRWAFFYNPMWGRLGDDNKSPPGSYYFSKGHVVTYFWNMFDQVLIRPSLLDSYKPENLVVVTSVGERSLITESRIDTSLSDHLPLVIKLDTELEHKTHVR